MWSNSDEKYKEWKTWWKGDPLPLKEKNGQRAERLKRTFQSQEMHVFRMNGLTEEPAGLFKIFKEKKGKETSFLNKRQIICLLHYV